MGFWSIMHMNREDHIIWWNSLSLDDRIVLCNKHFADWKWRIVIHSNRAIKRMWIKEINRI